MDKIRHVGHNATMVAEVVEKAKIQFERELGVLVAEKGRSCERAGELE